MEVNELIPNNLEPVANSDRSIVSIEGRIFNLRDTQVMIDKDLAELYNVETKVLNQAVKRNIDRFPSSFRFQLNDTEREELVTNCDRFKNLRHSTTNPHAFTEQGVAMLSSVLKSETAVKTSIRIIEAFVAMRRFMISNASLLQRIDRIEMKQLKTDEKVDAILDKLSGTAEAKQGIFYDGQIFDAYAIVAEMIRRAQRRIVLIDNYIDDTVLVQLAKRKQGVKVEIYDGQISRQLRQDVASHNAQYPGVSLYRYNKAHDRFLIIDNEVYHFGASFKDLGKRLFCFSKMEAINADEIIERLQQHSQAID